MFFLFTAKACLYRMMYLTGLDDDFSFKKTA